MIVYPNKYRKLSAALIKQVLGSGRGKATIPPTSQLVGWWKYNEGTGTTFNDSSSTNYPLYPTNGTGQGTWGTLPGTSATAYQLVESGTNYNPLVCPAPLNFGGFTPFSGSVWVNATTAAGSLMSNLDSSNSYAGWRFSWETGFSDLSLNILGGITPGGAIQISSSNGNLLGSTTYHVAFTYDGSGKAAGVNLFRNGVQLVMAAAMSDNLVSPTSTTQYFSMASVDNAFDFYIGWLCDARVYKQKLSPAQIALIYAAGPV
jgi:hypothetical protein